jgi:branched-subunit amino acid transport protein
MMTFEEVVMVVGMALVTFAVRYPVLALVGRITLPEPLLRALRFVPPAVLAAIIVPGVLLPDGERLSLGLENAHLVAGIASALIAWRTKNLLLTIVLGMLVFLGWRMLLSL